MLKPPSQMAPSNAVVGNDLQTEPLGPVPFSTFLHTV